MYICEHYEKLPKRFHRGSIAIGNFDGMHTGHREVINKARLFSQANRSPWGVLTFEPHPREIFNNSNIPYRLTPFEMKTREIAEMGIDFLIVVKFNLEFSQISAETFIRQILVENLKASYIVSGFNFGFGNNRAGNTRFLKTMGKKLGFKTAGVEQILDEDGSVISSTRIRDMLKTGNPKSASKLLGRYFEIQGFVCKGDQRGRKIGFPTANIQMNTYLRPAVGVYAIKATIDQKMVPVWHDGIANFGYRPTFNGKQYILEVHLFEFNEEIYGKSLRVQIIDYLRPEKKFQNIEALTKQIKLDCSEAKFILSSQDNEKWTS